MEEVILTFEEENLDTQGEEIFAHKQKAEQVKIPVRVS